MDRLFKSALSVRELKPHTDDDYADRLSRLYTVTVLVCFAFLVTTKQFVGSPIRCWCPAQFTESHRDYTDAVCWVSNTYYLPIERTIPGGRLDEAAAKIGYYQWVPLLLAGQAVLVFLPCHLWRFLCQRSGVNLAAIMDAAHVTSSASYLEVSNVSVTLRSFHLLSFANDSILKYLQNVYVFVARDSVYIHSSNFAQF